MAERGEKTCSGVRNPQSLRLHRPVLPELEFRRRLLGDEETMAYNHAYGGTASFPEERWDDWYARWIGDSSEKRFYRYLGDAERNCFVGEAAYYFDDDRNCYICSVIVLAAERRKGFGKQGLRLICEAARKTVSGTCMMILPPTTLPLLCFFPVGLRKLTERRSMSWSGRLCQRFRRTDRCCEPRLC